ncbi:hypothetical protein MKX03_017943 [Papaver bracteatum]|nr:hypothetical protein MKX03_017943 [Papaver bracteatum]
MLEHDNISSLNKVPDRLLVLGRIWWDETIPMAVIGLHYQKFDFLLAGHTTTCL